MKVFVLANWERRGGAALSRAEQHPPGTIWADEEVWSRPLYQPDWWPADDWPGAKGQLEAMRERAIRETEERLAHLRAMTFEEPKED